MDPTRRLVVVVVLATASAALAEPTLAVLAGGDNTHGQIGDGTTTQRLTPFNVVWQ